MTQQTGKLFVLEASGDGRLFSINPDGSDKTVIVTGCPVPDGVAVDAEAGHIYWTNMGMPPVRRRLDRTCRPRRSQPHHDRAQRRNLHPQAASSRSRGPQAVLV